MNNGLGGEAQDEIELRDGAEEGAHLLPSHEFAFDQQASRHAHTTSRGSHKMRWISGPIPPRRQEVIPIFPELQASPKRLLSRISPTVPSRRRLLYAFFILWVVLFSALLGYSSLPTKDVTGQDVVNLDCINTLWQWKNECGLNGIDCGPFTNKTLAFRCPPGCEDVKVLNSRLVGATDIIYRPLVVGGPQYRGDSFICASAIHAGVLSNSGGGCGRLARVGEGRNFLSSEQHGIASVAFDSYFPLTFTITEDASIRCGPGEFRRVLLFVSVLFTTLLCIFGPSDQRSFFTIFVAIFTHVAMVSDSPGASTYNTSTFPDHLSKLAEHLLPTLFCAVLIYQHVVAKTIANMQAPLEKSVLWLGGFWFGALSNMTFEWIPITRLTSHDLDQQTGAKLALAVIVIAVALIIVQQAYSFWLEGRLVRYLGLYAVFITAILVCLMLPGVDFRLHHYVIALLLLPGTSIQTRASLLYQGILLGLFVNGVARWGFASILETPDALRSDGAFESMIPSVSATVAAAADALVWNISFKWALPPVGSAFDAISILVNDVERHRAFFGEVQAGFTWSRGKDLGLPEYFRFAFVRDGLALDYSVPGVWYANGTWDAGLEI